MDAPLYVFSTGRAGTTFLTQLLQEIEKDIRISHQGFGSRVVNILGNAAVQLEYPALASAALRIFRGSKVPESTTDPLLSMALSAILPAEIKNLSTTPRLIHLVRDPRDFVRSFMNWKRQSIKRRFLHHVVPLWQPSRLLHGSATFYQNVRSSKFEHFAWIWQFKNRHFESALGSYPTYCRIRIEDLSNPTTRYAELRRLIDLLNLARPDERIRGLESSRIARTPVNRSEGTFPKWSAWSSDLACLLNRHCGRLMSQYGYGSEDKWEAILENCLES